MSAIPPPGPALPWAASGPAVPHQSSNTLPLVAPDGRKLPVRSLEDLGLQFGDRIEVQWEIEDGDEDEDEAMSPEAEAPPATSDAATATSSSPATAGAEGGAQPAANTKQLKWWGAVIAPVPGSTQALEQQRSTPSVYLLEYDAYEDFEAEEREVLFCNRAKLVDMDEKLDMRWRQEGREAVEEEQGTHPDEVAIDEMLDLMDEDAEEPPSTRGSGPLSVSQMFNVPLTAFQEQQFAEQFGSMIRGIVNAVENKGETVITEEDVREYLEKNGGDMLPKRKG